MARRMASIVFIAFLLGAAIALGPGTTLAAPEDGVVSVALKWPAAPAGRPRGSIALSYEVTSGTSELVETVERMTLPDGWRWVTPAGRLELAPGASRIRVHSVAVAAHASAGAYPVTYELRDAASGAVIARHSVNVEVKAVTALSVLPIQSPAYVVAGENYILRFMVTNTGNATADVELDATQQDGFIITHSRRVRLGAGASQEVEVAVRSSAAMKVAVMHRLTLRATAGSATASASIAVEVIPKATGEAYHLLPAQAYAKASLNKAGKWDMGLALWGNGYLDERSRHEVEFRLNSSSSSYLKYHSGALDLVLGQTDLGMSAVTRALPSAGVGVGLGYTALQVDWLTLEGNFAADRAGRIASAEAKVEFAPGWQMTLEAAAGKKAGESSTAAALRAEMEAQAARIGKYRLSLTYGQEEFPGRYSEGLLLEASAELPGLGPLSAGAFYTGRLGHADDAEWASQYGACANLAYMKGGAAWVSYRSPAITTAVDGDGRLSVGVTQKLGPTVLRARYDMELGRPEYDSLRLWLEYTPSWKQRYEIYYSGAGVRSENVEHTFGLKGGVWMLPQSWASLDVSRKVGTTASSTSIAASVRYDLAKNLMLQADARAIKPDAGAWSAEASMALTATHRFNLRVSELKSVGGLTGKVFETCSPDGEARPLAGVALRAGSMAAVTDADGVFRFSGMAPGNYYVQIDMTHLSEGCIPALATPAVAMISAGETTTLDIPITRKASLVGRVVLCQVTAPLAAASSVKGGTNGNGSANGNGYVNGADGTNGTNGNGGGSGSGLREAGGLAGVILSAALGDETRYAVTDADGRFSFTELRPGNWEVKALAGARWPKDSSSDPMVTTVTLAPEGKAEVVIRAVPIAKPLQMLEGGKIGF